MKTVNHEIFDWVNEIDNSIFALSASPIELKMLGSFKTKIASLIQKEKQQLIDAYNQGYRDGESTVASGMHDGLDDVETFADAELYYRNTFELKDVAKNCG